MNYKMTNYRTTSKWETIYKMEGTKIVAKDATELVTQLRKFAYDQPTTNKQHRERSFHWFMNVDGIQIDTTNDRAFVNDLIEYGYVRVLGCSRKPVTDAKNN